MIIFTRPATASSSPELLHSALIPWKPVWRSCDWIFDIGVTKIYIKSIKPVERHHHSWWAVWHPRPWSTPPNSTADWDHNREDSDDNVLMFMIVNDDTDDGCGAKQCSDVYYSATIVNDNTDDGCGAKHFAIKNRIKPCIELVVHERVACVVPLLNIEH